MKKTLRKLIGAACAILLAGTATSVQASHWQGSELTYGCVAPNVYIAKLKLYRDCTGIAASTYANLQLRSVGCNTGRTISMTKVGNSRIGDDYCSQITPTCTANGQPNYEEVVFSATVTFSSAEQNCQEWIMSWQECCRPASANLQNPQSHNLYAEALVRLDNNINNSSPEFGSLVVPFVGAYKPAILSSFAVDIDGDSLVYSLKEPMTNFGQTIPFTTFPATTLLSPDSTKSVTAIPGAYSPHFPMQSYFVDWSQTWPPVTPNFVLDAGSGALSFTPAVYHPNTPSVQGLNKYVFVVQVDEYRKVNGTVVRVGSIRRDMFMTVVDCGLNNNPVVTAPVANGQPITPATIIELRPGTPLTFNFATHDSNAGDALFMDSDVTAILPGASFTKTSGNLPTGNVTWTPTASDVRGQLYYFHITVQDNACPIKGQTVQTFAVRVSNNGGVTGLKPDQKNFLALQAYPNPFSQEINFKVNLASAEKGQEIVIYNSLGQQVDHISLKGLAAGEQQVRWNKGAKMASGQYVAKLLGASGQGHSIRFVKM